MPRAPGNGDPLPQSRPNLAAARRASAYTRGEIVGRVAWACASPLFALSPRPFFAWRRFLLRLFGARVGSQANVYSSTSIRLPWQLEIGEGSTLGERVLVYNLGLVRIGSLVTVSQGAHLCAGTHDHRDPAMLLQRPPITIGDDAWICADAFVGPGVSVGEGAVVGARAVVVKDVEPWTIVAGNPARPVGPRRLRA